MIKRTPWRRQAAFFVLLLCFLPLPLTAQAPLARDPRPCQIFIDQLEQFVKTDPLKGKSTPEFSNTFGPLHSPEERNAQLLQRAFAPGVGRAFFYQPQAGLQPFKRLLEAKQVKIGPSAESFNFYRNLPEDNDDDIYSHTIRYYDLSASSGYLVLSIDKGRDFCIGADTFKIIQGSRESVLEKANLDFGEGDLCAPSDFTVMNIDGVDYEVAATTILPDKIYSKKVAGLFSFYVALFPLTSTRDEAACDMVIEFHISGKNEGIYYRSRFVPTISHTLQ